jgi:isopenicillin-N epimerase
MDARPSPRSDLADRWLLDPAVVFLNHGSFGACPREVLRHQQALRERMERQPLAFFRGLEDELDRARAELAHFLGAVPARLAFVPNATTGVNAVLRSLALGPGDELLTTDHAYPACRNALEFVARRSGCTVIVARIGLPVRDEEAVLVPLLEAVTARTRLALIDHVTSPTGLVLPIERLVRELSARGVDVLVDGAHGPGMVPLALESLGAAWYAGNAHKWLCAPKGAGFLHARADRVETVRPVVISHGAGSGRSDRERFLLEFDWTGTADPTALLSVPRALDVVGGLVPGGWEAVRRRNRQLALSARRRLAAALDVPLVGPDAMVGSLAAVPVPRRCEERWPPGAPGEVDPLQRVLHERFRIEVPVIPRPDGAGRLVRLSAQLYNAAAEYDLLAAALEDLSRGAVDRA